DLVHRLPNADGSREVDDGVHAVERAPHGIVIAHVADLQLDGRVEVIRTLAPRVNLRVEVVQCPHLVAVGQQPVGEARPDDAGAACDQTLQGAGEAPSGPSRRGPSTARMIAPGSASATVTTKKRKPVATACSFGTPSWPRKLTKNASRTAMPLIVNGT